MNQDEASRRAEEVELPEFGLVVSDRSGATWFGYTGDQIREAIAAALVKLPTGNDPEMGFILEAATENEFAAYDYAVASHCQAVLEILDGKDNGHGTCNEPWEAVRSRLLALVKYAQGQEPRYFEQYQGQGIEEIDEKRFNKTPEEYRFKLYTHPIPSQQEERKSLTEGTAAAYLRDLVEALDGAFISSWQSTAKWQVQLDAARNYLKEQGK